VDGIIYAGAPFNVFAIDARDGTILWQYYWKTRGGTALQTRGVGMWHNYVYFTMHDNWVVCLDAKTGKEVWRHEIAPHEMQYFSSNAPMVIGDHLLVGTGNDTDMPAFLSRSIRRRVRCSGFCTRRRRTSATPASIRGRASTRRGTATARRGSRARTIRTRISTLRHRQPDAVVHAGPR
jgi:hypothetical protein